MTTMLGAASRSRVLAMGASSRARVRWSSPGAGADSTLVWISAGEATAIVDMSVYALIIRAYAPFVKSGHHAGRLQLPGPASGSAPRYQVLRPVPGADRA